MGVVNVTSLHSWSIDVTSLIEGILLTNAQYFSYRHPLLLWSTLQKFFNSAVMLVKTWELFRESRVQALILFRHFPLPMRITICDDDMISIAPAFRSMKSLDMGDAWTTHGVKIVPPHHVHRTFYLLVCITPVSQSVCVVEFNDHVRTPLRLRHVFSIRRFLLPVDPFYSWTVAVFSSNSSSRRSSFEYLQYSEITCRIIGFFDYHIVQCSVRRIYILEFRMSKWLFWYYLWVTQFCAHCVINCWYTRSAIFRDSDGDLSTGSSEYFRIRAQDAHRVSRRYLHLESFLRRGTSPAEFDKSSSI
jgi:hypothetical protein